MKRVVGVLTLCLAAAFIIAVVVGCGGGSGLSASSTCQDFANASPEEQQEAISSLATEFRTPEYVTPLGSPEVGYYCADNPDTTLEEFFKNAHQSEDAGAGTSGNETSLEDVDLVNNQLSGIPQEGTVLGRSDAKVELYEYADLQCPVCKAYSEEIIPDVIDSEVRDGNAKIVFRNFTIIGPESIPAGAAMIAAGMQGKGWNYLNLFYRNEGEERSGYITDEFMTEVAQGAGVPNIAKWNEDRKSPQVISEVEATTAEAQKLGFDGTPSFAVEGPGTSGMETLGSPGSAEALKEAIEEAG